METKRCSLVTIVSISQLLTYGGAVDDTRLVSIDQSVTNQKDEKSDYTC